jgi:hypothetical protein
MAIRPYSGITTVASSTVAQPIFGTTLTAASTFSVDRFTGNNKPGSTTPPVTLTVASSVGMKVDDRILVGLFASFTNAARLANPQALDQGTIASIVDATHITVQGLLKNHASGEYVVLNETASYIQLIPVTVASQFLVGTDSSTSLTDPSVYAVGTPAYWNPLVQPTATGCTYQTCEAWLLGTAADTYVASFYQV